MSKQENFYSLTELTELIVDITSALKSVNDRVQSLERRLDFTPNKQQLENQLGIPENDKFAELKEAHRNGAVIQVKTSISNGWRNVYSPAWHDKNEYRIKPEEQPKIGDVCKFWNYDERCFVIAQLVRIYNEKESYRYASAASSWRNAKTLNKQEAIKLLFGNEATN